MRAGRTRVSLALSSACLAAAFVAAPSRAGDPPPGYYVRKASWHETTLASREAKARLAGEDRPPAPLPDLGRGPFTVAAWIRTRTDGTIVAKAPEKGRWVPQGKTFFVRSGKLAYDVGWVGCVTGGRRVADGEWRHVALAGRGNALRFYVDGRADRSGSLGAGPDVEGHVLKIGYTSTNFPGPSGFAGDVDEVRVYGRELSANEVKRLFERPGDGTDGGLVGHWRFEGNGLDSSGGRNHASSMTKAAFTKGTEGKVGKALRLDGRGWAIVPATGGGAAGEEVWALVERDFTDETSRREMAWEREDGIWRADWRPGDLAEIARRYARASGRTPGIAAKAESLAPRVRDAAGLAEVRKLYLRSRGLALVLEELEGFEPLGRAVRELARKHAESEPYLARLAEIEARAARWAGADGDDGGEIDRAALARWKTGLAKLRREALVTRNPLLKCNKLLFTRRLTYSSNHYYTDYVNSRFTPGGGICTLSLKTGEVKELVPSLEGGVFGRFDLSFDAKRIVFDWKCAAQEGYRIYEVNVDGTGLRQLTFPEKNEKALVELYRARPHYHHGTDDMHPCYLPDGGIVFISTRCRYGILCDGPDDFTTTVLYRIDRGGKNMEKLTNSSVSEASPSIMNDGRILYTRWEYVDKGAVSVKCLWSMRPDGTQSSEVFGNDIAFPPSLIHGHAVPGCNNLFTVLGAPHYPQNRVGTIIRVDVNFPLRTREPMTYVTPEIDIRGEGGFHHRENGGWRHSDRGPLYADPYPLSPSFVLASYNPDGGWRDAKAYALYLVDEFGNRVLIHRDDEMSCWQPVPLRPRRTPPVLKSPRDPELAKKNLAVVAMTDVYAGLDGIERGTVKYLRVLEQMPRPWAARRRWGGDCYDQQHAVISKDCALGLKVQYGVVPVEKDGSAHFLVEADRNIFFQALDEDYMEVRRMRTYVNFRPGESRSCIGCHEYRREVPASGYATAMRRPPSVPGPQPGEKSGRRPYHYPTDVQPALDRHCVRCHSGNAPKAGLDLTGEPTRLFSRSYENIIDRGLVRRCGENHPKTGNVAMTPPKTWGSHASRLVAHLKDPNAPCEVKLSREEWIRLTTWVDSNAQYYGSYYGRRNLEHRDHPNFRPVPTFAEAVSTAAPLPEPKR